MINRREGLAALLGVLLGGATRASADTDALAAVLPFEPAAFSPAAPPKKLVLSHWHFFPISIDNKPAAYDYYTRAFLDPQGEKGRHAGYGGYLRDRPIPRAPIPSRDWMMQDAASDIAFAQGAGVDAFQFNLPNLDPASSYRHLLNTYMTQIERSGSSFRIVPCPDCVSLDGSIAPETVAQQLRPLLTHPSALVMPDGRPALSCFLGEKWSVERWRAVIGALSDAGTPVYFMPMYLDRLNTTDAHIDLADMVGWWAGNFPGGVADMKAKARWVRSRGKSVMWSVWPQDVRPRAGWFAEAENSATLRLGWSEGISFGADAINVLTWNDYSESSSLRPSLDTQFAFADLNRYFSDWYKTGTPPRIIRDVLYFFHRVDYTGAERGTVPGRPPMRMQYGSRPKDEVEVLALLASPGVIEIENARGLARMDAGAGLSSVRAPLAPGRQSFRLLREGSVVLAFDSPFPVRESWTWQDLTYRGGSSSRPPVADEGGKAQ